ncbi:phytanoyl-CoA dioxygenase family protein [Hoeflea sp.]|uniref:phytanoyl-CoA dioxygenase family protein n=1 Tax=Hoeflea sp. TaxID=1940281 RepID=UPI0025BBDC6B|nr:phytanoyl-CoA dioxygenase family protein [Hoeflea sp.]
MRPGSPIGSKWFDMMISPDDRNFFQSEGYLLIKGFFDFEKDILPIQRDAYEIIGLVAERHGVELERQPFDPETFDRDYYRLLETDRRYAAEVYDLTKQIPSFLRLISSTQSEELFRTLRGTDHAGIGAASYGIRIDNPNEDKFRSHWHQEFLFQPQSMDGIVFWTPLAPVRDDMGAVIILPKSHKDGLCVYSRGTTYADKAGAYQIGIHDEAAAIGKYEQVAPLTEPGDLLIMDFLTIHASGENRSTRSRWSIQSRFFNFKDPVGMKIGWKASITTGTQVEELFPDNFVSEA